MSYQITIWFRTNDEWDCFLESFPSLEDCADFFYGHFVDPVRSKVADIEINGHRVRVNNGRLVGNDMEPFCTNAKWHEIFADHDYPRIFPLSAFERNFRPRQSTNPATLIAKGAL